MTIPFQTPPTTPPLKSTFQIPTIDVSPYLSDPESIESQDIVNQVRDACVSTGFFQLTGHNIPRQLQDDVFKGAEKLFSLSTEEKLKMDKRKSIGASNRGYEVLGGQGLEEGMRPDLKEAFYISQHLAPSDPRVQKCRFLMGPNIWPTIPKEYFQTPMENYYKLMFDLSLTVLDILAKGLPYGDDVFEEFKSNDAVAALRLLHYPPDKSGDEKQLGAGAHTDFGAITLLLQDEVGGLQVWDSTASSSSEKEGKWVDVPPNPSAYVFNVGDMLQMWTSGKYKSSVHRVVNRSGRDRYSVPFFFDGNIDCVLKPLDGSEVEGEVLTVEGHMRERFASTYGRGKKDE